MSSLESVKTPSDVSRDCEESIDLIQLVADLLLLHGDPEPTALEPVTSASDSYAKCRDTIVARTKGLAIMVNELATQIRANKLADVSRTIRSGAEAVVALTEAATHAAYTVGVADPGSTAAYPGLVDRYRFSRAKHRILGACARFDLSYGILTEQQILQISAQIAHNLTILTETCQIAANQAADPQSQDQFRQCSKSISGTTAALLASIKAYAKTRQDKDREKCVIFSKPLIEVIDAVLAFGALAEYAGEPARMSEIGKSTQQAILGGAMATVASCVKLFNVIPGLVRNVADTEAWKNLMLCSKAVAEATKLLCSALREHSIEGLK
ncbi:talin rod domain-containing protein 1-like [Oscarella lobularis]|uniref:talin rod domain-containing protein 1-like n=1 Tax=Oscarella lobularis TaxID=121494 RepID=UPI0033141DF6